MMFEEALTKSSEGHPCHIKLTSVNEGETVLIGKGVCAEKKGCYFRTPFPK